MYKRLVYRASWEYLSSKLPRLSSLEASPSAVLEAFAPRKAQRCTTPRPEVEEKTPKAATPKVKATPKAKALAGDGECVLRRPRGRPPVVDVGKKKGQAMQWNKQTGLWQEP